MISRRFHYLYSHRFTWNDWGCTELTSRLSNLAFYSTGQSDFGLCRESEVKLTVLLIKLAKIIQQVFLRRMNGRKNRRHYPAFHKCCQSLASQGLQEPQVAFIIGLSQGGMTQGLANWKHIPGLASSSPNMQHPCYTQWNTSGYEGKSSRT